MAYDLHRDPRSSHQRIARQVRSLGVDPILDVGASNGQLGRLLHGSGLVLDAIEPDPVAAAEAAPHYRALQVATVEEAALPARMYRTVVCADVLEHLQDPEAQLRRLIGSSTPGATFIISVPNVAHLAARMLLLVGKFPRHQKGIFDRTHLHFYTRETVLDLVTGAGLAVSSIETTPVPLEEIWPPRWPVIALETLMKSQVAAGRVAPRLFGFQWLVVARRR